MSYTETDQQLHLLSQILAKFNRTYLKAKDDDSHTNMGYGPINRRLFSRWANLGPSSMLLSLELETFTFALLDKAYRRELEVICKGKTISQIESELKYGLSNIGFKTEKFSEPMHYEIPDYGMAENPIENLTKEAFVDWTDLRALASYACHQIQAHFQVNEEVRIWPHHFDTGIFVPLNDKLSIGFGLAMQDKWADSAYFYYTALYDGKTHWPENRPMGIAVGRIIESSEFCGAILEAPGVDLKLLREFMREGSGYYLGFL